MGDIAASINQISRSSEQNSVRSGLLQVEAWRNANLGTVLGYPSMVYESPGGLFKVTFTSDFGIHLGGDGVAVHVWNTARPQLLERMVYGALSLFRPLYQEGNNSPDDLAVLSLPDQAFHRLSEAGQYGDLGPPLVDRLENIVREVRDDLGLPDADYQPDHPIGRP